MEKRLIIAIALSILIIMTFQYFGPKPKTLPPPAPTQTSPVGETAPVITIPRPEPSIEEKELVAETDKFILTFSNIGGAIKSIQLKDFKNLGTKEPLDLTDIKSPKDYIFNITSPVDSELPYSLGYDIEKNESEIICSARAGGLAVIKKYILHNSKSTIELELFIKNTSSSPKNFSYAIIGGAGVTESHDQDKRFVEVLSKINGKKTGFKRIKEGRIINPGVVDWTALKNKYFSLILKPFATTKNQFYAEGKNGELTMGVTTEAVTIDPGATIEHKYLLYAGPSVIKELLAAGYGFEDSVDYGFFGGISKALIAIMRVLYNVVHSWGVVIILLSILLNVILFPLTVKSFRSMQKMQELHPQMEKLKIQFKDNPQKLNKEIMELYKKYNINPMSGCLPVLLQMPIFISLYNALMKSIELRGTNFLWIKDLSMPDAVPIPISLPLFGSSINILPLFMVAAMVIQQKISTKTMGAAVTPEQKQQQKMMMVMMPVVFGFIFYNMPSGLVLYWVVNTVLTIVEQAAILKRT